MQNKTFGKMELQPTAALSKARPLKGLSVRVTFESRSPLGKQTTVTGSARSRRRRPHLEAEREKSRRLGAVGPQLHFSMLDPEDSSVRAQSG